MPTFGLDLIHAARAALQDLTVNTPLLNSPMLDAAMEARVFVKPECLQVTGAFKYRGALFKMSTLAASELARGVITYSAGNHAQAVAAAGKKMGCRVVVVMPNHAPQIKQDNCRWWGAEVVRYDKNEQDREDVMREIIQKEGLYFIPPFDDDYVMAGQGTIGLEIIDAMEKLGIQPDSVWTGCSGGGLAAGVITALSERYRSIEGVIVEAEGYTKWRDSRAVGRPLKLEVLPSTLIDGIAGPSVGKRPFDVLKDLPILTEEARQDDAIIGMQAAFRYLKVVVEPGGAAALGTLIREKRRYKGKTVVVVCSGGNVDPDVFRLAVQSSHFSV